MHVLDFFGRFERSPGKAFQTSDPDVDRIRANTCWRHRASRAFWSVRAHRVPGLANNPIPVGVGNERPHANDPSPAHRAPTMATLRLDRVEELQRILSVHRGV